MGGFVERVQWLVTENHAETRAARRTHGRGQLLPWRDERRAKPFEVKMDPASGLVQPTRGIAVFSRPDYLERFGSARRPAGLNSPATRSSAGFVMREIQTGLHKPESGTKRRLTKSPIIRPVCLPNCALICLGSRVSFDLPLALPGHQSPRGADHHPARTRSDSL